MALLREEFEKLQKAIERMAATTETDINNRYRRTLEETRNLMRKMYDKYADRSGLDYATMSKYGRLDKLEQNVAELVQELYKDNSRMTRNLLNETYRNSYETARNVTEELAGKTIRGQIKDEIIQQAINDPVSGLKLSQRLEKNRNNIIFDIQETLTQGLKEGESYSQMSSRLKDSLEGDVPKAHRIVRTESHRIMEQGKLDQLDHAYKQGVEMRKYWVDSGDEKVRSDHEFMAEKYSRDKAIPYNENFVNDKTGGEGPAPGQLGVAKDDIFCRCFMNILVANNE